tara:strand:- start:2262 stop:5465 length:3204 start_codon:yes stop_codon:yes gene_type:complete
MAQNFPDSPSNGATQAFNGITYTYNSSKAIWTAKTSAGISLTDLSVGAEPSASGNGDVSYNNTTGVITYTPPVLSSGGTTTVYNTASLLPLSGNSDGDMAFAKDNNRFYVWNGAGWYSVALVNASPTISSGVSSTVTLATDGTATVITITASDPEGTSLNYAYSVTSGSLTNGGGATATVAQGTGASTNVFTVTPTTNQSYAGTFTLTFTASDGVNTATSAGAFSLVFSVPQTRGTALKVKTSGNNGRTNAVFDDSSSSNHTLTANGDAYQSTFNPYFPETGYWGVKFAAKVDQLNFASVDLGTGNFTIEAWVNPDNLTGYHAMIAHDNTSNSYFQFHMNGAHLEFYEAAVLRASNVMVANEWQHVALTKNTSTSPNTFTIYRNGVQVAQATHGTAVRHINRIGNYAAGNTTEGFQGKMTNVRLSNTLRYTGNFTNPMEPFTSDSNTLLLACASNRFIDNSSNAVSLTSTNDSSVLPFTPFKASDVWEADEGGSMYLDGAGDYLAVPDSTDFTFTGDFTAECWHYATSHKQLQGIIAFQSDGESNGFALVGGASATKYHLNVKMATMDTTSTMILNQWNHVALVRYGSGSGNVKIYINGVADATTTTQTATVTKISNPSFGRPPGFTTRDYLGWIADARISNTARYTSNFTPPTAPLGVDSNTKLKVNFDQAGIHDTAATHSLKLYSGVSESTSQVKYATTSVYYNGSYIKSTNESFIVGEGDMQIQFWLYMPAVGGNQGFFHCSANPQGSSTDGFAMYSAGGTIYLYHGPGGSGWTSSSTMPTNQWVHHVYLRRNGKLQHFQNGVRQVDIANTANWTGTVINIGNNYDTNNFLTGYMEDFEFLNGHTTYPNERPQEALTAVSGTGLQFANASSIPSSPNGLTLSTTEGTPVVSSFSPPYSDMAYSIYYDGSSMHTVSASTNIHLGTGDFTVEGHFYIVEQVGTYDALFGCRLANNANGFAMAFTASKMYVYCAPDYVIDNIPYEYKKWMHIAYQRKTISGTATHQFYRDGILIGEGTVAKNYLSQGMYIGGDLNGGENFKGYVSDFRIIKGTAIYSKSFTPPSAAL